MFAIKTLEMAIKT